MARFAFGILNLAIFWAVSAANAEKMDLSTHDLMIQKITSARQGLGPSSREYPNLTLRLADLYADRARLKVLAAGEKNQEDATARSDRSEARKLYEAILPRLKGEERGRVLVQAAHLAQMAGDTDAAMAQLTQAIELGKKSGQKIPSELLARALAARADLHFRASKFQLAEKDFRAALAQPGVLSPGFLTYRLAWSQLNQGAEAQALKTLKTILSEPSLLTIDKKDEAVFDDGFHETVVRDLVIFLARQDVGEAQIDDMLAMTPESLQRDNLYALAQELERLGKKQPATLAWARYNAMSDTDKDQLETLIRTAQLKWDMGKKAAALAELQQAAEIWRLEGCKSEKCEDLRIRMKNFVVTWHKTEKESPSLELLSAYEAYVGIFTSDVAMTFKAAEVATSVKRPARASELFRETVLRAEKHQITNESEVVEAALLNTISEAEKSNNADERIKAYNFYLKYRPEGADALKVQYQRAHVYYSRSQYDEAQREFRDILSDSRCKDTQVRSWCVLAAELTLDILAVQKDDQQLMSSSLSLSQSFPERKTAFLKIHRQAAIKIAGASAKNPSAGSSEWKKAAQISLSASRDGANLMERKQLAQNELALGEKLMDRELMRRSTQSLLALGNLSASERETALGYQQWLAELEFDFAGAYKIARRMSWPRLTQAERQLKLATLAELAGMDAGPHYEQALRGSKSITQANGIRALLVRQANDPWRMLKKFRRELLKSPELLAILVVEAQARRPSASEARSYLGIRAVARQPIARLLEREPWLGRILTARKSLMQHRLTAQSDRLLRRSLEERLRRLHKIATLDREAIRLNHTLGQVLTLTTLKSENQRLHDELLALPVPRALRSAKEKKNYVALLRQKAAPFQKAAESAHRQLTQIWKQNVLWQDFGKWYRAATPEVRKLVHNDIAAVIPLANGGPKSELVALLEFDRSARSNQGNLGELRQRAKEDPFDLEIVKEMKNVASSQRQYTLAAYLDGRIQTLRSRSRQ